MHDVEIKKEKDLQLTNLSTVKEVSFIIHRILRDTARFTYVIIFKISIIFVKKIDISIHAIGGVDIHWNYI